MPEREEVVPPEQRLGLTESETRTNLSVLDLSFVARWNQISIGKNLPTANDVLDITRKLANTDAAAREWEMPPTEQREVLGRASLLLARYLDEAILSAKDATALISGFAHFIERMNEIDTENPRGAESDPIMPDYVREAARQLNGRDLTKVASDEPTTEYLRIVGRLVAPEQPPEGSER